eukprot:jgi/Botrbrau1/20051/Bobra.200_1s0056.1
MFLVGTGGTGGEVPGAYSGRPDPEGPDGGPGPGISGQGPPVSAEQAPDPGSRGDRGAGRGAPLLPSPTVLRPGPRAPGSPLPGPAGPESSPRGPPPGPRLPPGVRIPQRTMEAPPPGSRSPQRGPQQRGPQRGPRPGFGEPSGPRGPPRDQGLRGPQSPDHDPDDDLFGDDMRDPRRDRRAIERRRRELAAKEGLERPRTPLGPRRGPGGEAEGRRQGRGFRARDVLEGRDPEAVAAEQRAFFENLQKGKSGAAAESTRLTPRAPGRLRSFDLDFNDFRSMAMMELDPNMKRDIGITPDPNLPSPPDVAADLERMKPYFMEQLGIESEELWQVLTEGSVEYVEQQARKLGYRSYRLEEAQLLERAREMFPEGHPFHQPAQQAMKAVTANPTWSSKQKTRFLESLQREFLRLEAQAAGRSLT